jgi:prolipoprotein diacylglyceryl transferase
VIWDIDPTLIGPYELPWHALLALADLFAVAYVVWRWRKQGTVTLNDFWGVLVCGAAHAFYTVKLAETHPVFDLEIRYYGLCFAIGLLLGARALPLYFERWGFPRKHAEALTLWTPVGMLLGAHFVHLLFYETDALLHNPIRIFQLGSGLASHGGGLGAIVATVLFARRNNVDPLRYMDAAMCGATWVIPWVRVGNFFNSEIVGRAWDGPFAIAFPRHDCPGYPGFERGGEFFEVACDHPVLRHPSQAYEAILGFIMVGIAVYLQAKWRNRLRPGAIIFILLAYYFTTRFLIEYTKEYQTLATDFPFTMGQMLSLPIVLVSLYMLFVSKKSNILRPLEPGEAQTWRPPYLGEEAMAEEGASPEPLGAKTGKTAKSKSADDADASPSPAKRPKKKRKKKS